MSTRLPDGLEAAIGEFADPARSGWLVATNGRVQKRIAFEGGSAVFSASNDPKDLMGQALLRAGLISEKDLAQALAMPREAGAAAPHLYTALVAMRKVTPEQTKVVFEQKLRESVLDLFLWPAGTAEILPGPLDESATSVFPTTITVSALLEEGAKRRTRWKTVKRALPSFDVAFERKADWPEPFPGTPGDKRLAKLLEEGQTLSKILLELHGQDYAVGVRVANLLQRGVLATRAPGGFDPAKESEIIVEVEVPAATPEAPPPRGRVSTVSTLEFAKANPPAVLAEQPTVSEPSMRPPDTFSPELSAALLEKARALAAEKKHTEAIAVLTELVQNDPLAAGDAWALMSEVEAVMVAEAQASGFSDEVTFTLARPVTSFVGVVLPPDEAFVLSRFAAGRVNVGQLRALCPFPPVELFRILRKFLDEKMVKRV